VIGGLLAFSSLRQRPDVRTAALVTILYCFFAYKNLGAIRDVTYQRFAILETIKAYAGSAAAGTIDPVTAKLRETVEPTLVPPDYPGTRNFHIASDALTVLAVWAMELRRARLARGGANVVEVRPGA
jgi:hypothetical protein